MSKNEKIVFCVGIGIPVIMFFVFMIYWLGIRDTWETDNMALISARCEIVERAISKSDVDAAAQAYADLKRLIGDRTIQGKLLGSRVDAVHQAFILAKDQIEQARIADERERVRKAEAIANEARALRDAAQKRFEQQKHAELIEGQQAREKALFTKNEARKTELEAIERRDQRLLAECATRTTAPKPIRISIGGGILEVSYQFNTLYMLTGKVNREGMIVNENADGSRRYNGGKSSIHVLVSYTVNGATSYGTDEWFKIDGEPNKLSVTTSDEKVLKASSAVQTFIEPVGPGAAIVYVSLGNRTVSIPILVVPLKIADGESSDSVIQQFGLPDDDLFVYAIWPESKRVHNLVYYDNLRGNGGGSAHHWKFNRFPGAVVVVDGKSVINVSSTSPEDYSWPKDNRR